MTTINPLFVKLCIPNGLEEVLEGLAREVLRRQPENIHSFAAVYFDKLLEIRTEAESRGTDINLQNLIARGKFLDIQEEDLLKISSTKDQVLLNGEEPEGVKIEDLEENEMKSAPVNEIEEMQQKMTTAAAVSKPAQVQLMQRLVAVIDEEVNENEAIQVDDLEKTTLDMQDLESNDTMAKETLSEKSSDNSELDDEQTEELESQLETTMGMQMDPIDEISEENEMDSLEVSNKTADLQSLEGTRRLEMTEIQLNGKPAEFNADGIAETRDDDVDDDQQDQSKEFNTVGEDKEEIQETPSKEIKMKEMRDAPEAPEDATRNNLENSKDEEEIVEESIQERAEMKAKKEPEFREENVQEELRSDEQQQQEPDIEETEVIQAKAMRRQSDAMIILDANPQQEMQVIEETEEKTEEKTPKVEFEKIAPDESDIKNDEIQKPLEDKERTKLQEVLGDVIGSAGENQAADVEEKVMEKLSEDKIQEEMGGNEPLNNDEAIENSADEGLPLARKSSKDELDLVDYGGNNHENVGKDMILVNGDSEQIEKENNNNNDSNVGINVIDEKTNENDIETENEGLSENIPDETLNETTSYNILEQQTITGEDIVEEISQEGQKVEFPEEDIRLDNYNELIKEERDVQEVENDEKLLEISNKEDGMVEEVAEESRPTEQALDGEEESNDKIEAMRQLEETQNKIDVQEVEELVNYKNDEKSSDVSIPEDATADEEVAEESMPTEQALDNVEESKDNNEEIRKVEETDAQEDTGEKLEDANEEDKKYINVIGHSLATAEDSGAETAEMMQPEDIANTELTICEEARIEQVLDIVEESNDSIAEMKQMEETRNETDVQVEDQLENANEDSKNGIKIIDQSLDNVEDSAEEITSIMQTEDVVNAEDMNISEMQLMGKLQNEARMQGDNEEKIEEVKEGINEDIKISDQSLANAEESVEETTEIIQTEDVVNIENSKNDKELVEERTPLGLDNVEEQIDNIAEMQLQEESQNESEVQKIIEEKIEEVKEDQLFLANAEDSVTETTEMMQTENVVNIEDVKDEEELTDNVEKQIENIAEMQLMDEPENETEVQEAIEEKLEEVMEDQLFSVNAEDSVTETTEMMQAENVVNIIEEAKDEELSDKVEKQIENIEEMQLMDEPKTETEVLENIEEKLEEAREDQLFSANAEDSVTETTEIMQAGNVANTEDAKGEEELSDKVEKQIENIEEMQLMDEPKNETEVQEIEKKIEEVKEENNEDLKGIDQFLVIDEGTVDETAKLKQAEDNIYIEKSTKEDHQNILSDIMKEQEDPEEINEEFKKEISNIAEEVSPIIAESTVDISENIEESTNDIREMNPLTETQEEQNSEEKLEDNGEKLGLTLVSDESEIQKKENEELAQTLDNIEESTDPTTNPSTETLAEQNPEVKLEEFSTENSEELVKALNTVESDFPETENAPDNIDEPAEINHEKDTENAFEEQIDADGNDLQQETLAKDEQDNANSILVNILESPIENLKQQDAASNIPAGINDSESDSMKNTEGIQLFNEESIIDISRNNFEDIIAEEKDDISIENTIGNEDIESVTYTVEEDSDESRERGNDAAKEDDTIETQEDDKIKSIIIFEITDDGDDSLQRVIDDKESTDDKGNDEAELSNEKISLNDLENDESRISEEMINGQEESQQELAEGQFEEGNENIKIVEENQEASIDEIEKQSEESNPLMSDPLETSITINPDEGNAESELKENIDFETEIENNKNEKAFEETTYFEVRNNLEEAESKAISVNDFIQQNDISGELETTEETVEENMKNLSYLDELNEGKLENIENIEQDLTETDNNMNTSYLRVINDTMENKDDLLIELDSLEENNPLQLSVEVNQELQSTRESEESNTIGEYLTSDDTIATVEAQDVVNEDGSSEESKENENSLELQPESLITIKEEMDIIDSTSKEVSVNVEDSSLTKDENGDYGEQEVTLEVKAENTDEKDVQEDFLTNAGVMPKSIKNKQEVIEEPNIVISESLEVQDSISADDIMTNNEVAVETKSSSIELQLEKVDATEPKVGETSMTDVLSNEEITDDNESKSDENLDKPGQTKGDEPPTYEEFFKSQSIAEIGIEMQVSDETEKMQVQEPEIIKLNEQLEEPNFAELFNKLESKSNTELEEISDNNRPILESLELEQKDVTGISGNGNNADVVLENLKEIPENLDVDGPQMQLVEYDNNDTEITDETKNQNNTLNLNDEILRVDVITKLEAETETTPETDDKTLANDNQITDKTDIMYVNKEDETKEEVNQGENIQENINKPADLSKTDLEEISLKNGLDSEQAGNAELINTDMLLDRESELPENATGITTDNNVQTTTATETIQPIQEILKLDEKIEEDNDKSNEKIIETLQTMEQGEIQLIPKTKITIEDLSMNMNQQEEAQLTITEKEIMSEIESNEQQDENNDSVKNAAMIEQPETGYLVGNKPILDMVQSEIVDVSDVVQAEPEPDEIIGSLTESNPQQEETSQQYGNEEVLGQLVDGGPIPEGDLVQENEITEVIENKDEELEKEQKPESPIIGDNLQKDPQNTSDQLAYGSIELNDISEKVVQEESSVKIENDETNPFEGIATAPPEEFINTNASDINEIAKSAGSDMLNENDKMASKDSQVELNQNANPSPVDILYFDVKTAQPEQPQELISAENSPNSEEIMASEPDKSESINIISENNDQDEDSDVIVGLGLVTTPEEQSSRFRKLIP